MTYGGPTGPQEPEGPSPEPIGYVDRLDSTQHTPPAKPSRDPWGIVVGILGGVLLGTGVTLAVLGLTGVFEEPEPPPTPTLPPPPELTVPPPVTGRPELPTDDPTAAAVAERAVRSIVAVESNGFLGSSSGSGVVYGEEGYIITNHHVVEDADDLSVVFSDGARYPAELVGSDPETDLAVLKIARDDLAPIDLGSSSDLEVGQVAIAVGNPLALVGGPSVTTGIVSALGRSLEIDSGTTLYGLIQTDAPITRGSSGGALLDGSARLIGITTAIAVSDVGAEGLGFAIPSDMVVGIVNDLIADGSVEHALIGISGTTAFAERDGAQYPVGVLVQDLLAQSAYEQGGGQVNDVIVRMNGAQVTTLNELLTTLRFYRAGDEMVFGVNRTEGDLDLTITLGRLDG